MPVAGETIHVRFNNIIPNKLSMVRFRSKSDPEAERGNSLKANPPVGECGDKNQVS